MTSMLRSPRWAFCVLRLFGAVIDHGGMREHSTGWTKKLLILGRDNAVATVAACVKEPRS